MDKSDKFLCETHRCTITVSGCLLRQERNSEKKQPPAWMFNKIPGDPKCANCEQGKQVKKGNYQPIQEDFMDVKTEMNELEAMARAGNPTPLVEKAKKEPMAKAEKKKRGPGRPPEKAEPEIKLKTCRICKGAYPADKDHFHTAPSNKDGLDNRCKDCARQAKAKNRKPPVNPRSKPVKPVQVPDKKIVQVDFTEYPELWEKLAYNCKLLFRTPELQILSLIDDETNWCEPPNKEV